MSEKFDNTCWYDSGESPFGHASDFKSDSIAEGRAWLLPRFRSGIVSHCPCCSQVVKLYPRTITKSMVMALSVIARRGPIAPDDIGTRGGDYGKLVYWGMILRVNKLWRITTQGRLFLSGELHVPKWMLVYNDTVMGASIRHMDVHEAVGERFSFEELMDPATVEAATA